MNLGRLLTLTAEWLIINAVPHGNYSVLEYNFPWPEYNLIHPWYSSTLQARALQVLVRAHELTNDHMYMITAKDLLNAFFAEVKDGGVTYKTPRDGWWYEEYAGSGGEQPRVLNGMMYSLLGIYDYYKYTNDSKAKYLFDQAVLCLKKTLVRLYPPVFFRRPEVCVESRESRPAVRNWIFSTS